jgi:hypothetical protein
VTGGIELIPVRGLGEVTRGTDLAAVICDAVELLHHDVVVVTQKVVSKAARVVAPVTPSVVLTVAAPVTASVPVMLTAWRVDVPATARVVPTVADVSMVTAPVAWRVVNRPAPPANEVRSQDTSPLAMVAFGSRSLRGTVLST